MNNALFAKAAAAACMLGAISASAATFTPEIGIANRRAAESRAAGKSVYRPLAVDADGKISPDLTMKTEYFETGETSGIVQSPDGQDWYYTLDLDYDVLQSNEYYTERSFKGFHIKVYDTEFNFVGQAKQNVLFPEGYTKGQQIIVGMQITRSFFNNNAKDYEVMIQCNFNPGIEGVYGAQQTTEAYSLTDEIPEGGSKRLFHAPGIVVSTVNQGNTVSENFVMGLSDNDVFTIYKKAGYGTPATALPSLKVDYNLVSADGHNEALPFVMTTKGNDIYVATAHYEKTFLKDPTAEEPEQNPDNNYIIELYRSSGDSYELIKTTKIACTEAEGENFYFRSYALGNFAGNGDITFDFGDGNLPAYIITVVESGVTDDTSGTYIVYDSNGKEIKRFGENSDGFAYFKDIKGMPVQFGFDMESKKTGEYGTVLVDYPSLEETGFLPKLFEYDGDVWTVITVPDRTMLTDGIFYAANVMPSGGPSESAPAYIGWFRQDGTVDHIDTLWFGENTAKVLTNIQGSVLDPYLFDTDRKMEYLSWVYRWKPDGVGTTLELVISDSEGNIKGVRKLDGTTAGQFCVVTNTTYNPGIMITYRLKDESANKFVNQVAEFVKLPLNSFEGNGTAESPYLIETWGDLNKIRYNLTSHFRLKNSIDCGGRSFNPIEGEFTGSLDGAGFEIKNVTINASNSGAAFFCSLGSANIESTARPVLKNITFSDITLNYDGPTLGTKELAIVANKVYNAEMTNVYVVNPVFENSTINVYFGTLACKASNLTAESCGVHGANIALSRSTGLGGLVYEARGGSYTACSFAGKLEGRIGVGGLVSQFAVKAAAVADAHVIADIKALANAGGIAAHSNRTTIHRAIVEGTITADGYVGGIVGALDMAEEPEADDFRVIDNCVVALDELNVGDDSDNIAHRIVGRSLIDEGNIEVFIPDPDDPESTTKGQYVTVPASHEPKLGDNYVITDIAPFETPAEGTLATEGITRTENIDSEWFSSLGYAFGFSADEPWRNGMSVPVLYYEAGLTSSMIFSPDQISGIEGTTAKAVLKASNVDFGNFTAEVADESIATVSYMNANDDMTVVEIGFSLLKAGETTFTAQCGDTKAILYIVVKAKSGINDAEVAAGMTYDGRTVRAAGCDIELFDMQSRRVAAAAEALSTEALQAGIYVARATTADGKTLVLKITVR